MTDLKSLLIWQQVFAGIVRDAGPDLTTRQLAVLLTVYMQDKAHTVRGLAVDLAMSKPAVCRALDRLSEQGLLRRKRDSDDLRNVLVQRTVRGAVFLSDFSTLLNRASQQPVEIARLQRLESLLNDLAGEVDIRKAA